MEPNRWQQVDKLLELALEQKPEKRVGFLDKACADDEELRREVESLRQEPRLWSLDIFGRHD